MSVKEDDLLTRLANPNTKAAAFSKVVEVYQERLYWHVRKMVLSHDDANDILQNTFMKAWKGLAAFRGDAQLSSWLYKISTNETMTFLANKRMRNIPSMEDVESMLLNQLHADHYFNGNEAEMRLQEAILTLPEKQRLVFNMKYFDNLTYEAMGKILNTSIGALKASYHHAVKKLEKVLSEDIPTFKLKVISENKI